LSKEMEKKGVKKKGEAGNGGGGSVEWVAGGFGERSLG